MTSIPKLIHRFVGIFLLSSVCIVILNVIAFIVLMANNVPDKEDSPYNIARETGAALQLSANGKYVLSEKISSILTDSGAWAILIDNATHQVLWKTPNVPATIPDRYKVSDIADLSVGYLNGYPTYTGDHAQGVVVLGFPKTSFWKHTQPSWKYSIISHFPQMALSVIGINVLFLLGIYLLANIKLLKSINPITKGIQNLSDGKCVHLPETGTLCEISAHINAASDILQKQKEQLRKKEMARVNWIAGVSHDIRTPLSMVMGYAGQLENSPRLSEAERKKATRIIKQSERMKNLIQDLNLASKLEYTMQPIQKKEENIVAVVRQVVVDFMNMGMPEGFSIQWETDEELTVCNSNVDKVLLKRAVANLIQNSIIHNENGCTIYVSVSVHQCQSIIRVADDGIGGSDEILEQLNHTPHYMLCDTGTSEQRHGLGLLIVRQIVDAHNGTVAIKKSECGGFLVTITIPIDVAGATFKEKKQWEERSK